MKGLVLGTDFVSLIRKTSSMGGNLIKVSAWSGVLQKAGIACLSRNSLPYMDPAMAARSKAWVCGCSLAGIACSNPAGGLDVCLLRMLCVVR